MVWYLRIIPMLSCMGILFFLSNQPGEVFPPLFFPGEDKLVHMAVYGVLCGAVIFSFSDEMRADRRPLVFMAAVLVAVIFGISDEYHQRFVAGRSAEFLDLVADAVGALLVSGVWYFKGAKR